MQRSSRLASFLVLVLFILATPSINAGWLQQDIPVCTDVNQQRDPVIVSDGQGSTLIAWEGGRGSYRYDIFAQKLDADGNALWPANGINMNVSEANRNGLNPSIVPDGAGGAFVAFERDSVLNYSMDCFMTRSQIIVAKIDASGVVSWKKPINASPQLINETNVRLFPDGARGAILVWETDDYYWEPYGCAWWEPYYLFVQRIDADGNRLWGLDPVRVSLNIHFPDRTFAAQDDSGSIIVAWSYRWSSTSSDIYAQKIDLGGNRLWGDEGVPINLTAGTQTAPRAVSDGEGGAVFAWLDSRGSTHIYAQRLDASGNPLWPADGLPVCTTDGTKNESEFGIIRGDSGSSIVYWTNPVNGKSALFAERLDLNGNPLWNVNGKQFSDGINPCRGVRGMPDGEGGAVFAWERVIPQPPKSNIMSLWGFSSNDIYAVGNNGWILHYDGTEWSLMSAPTTNHLNGVWGTATDNVYAVGEYYTILHYDGSAWHRDYSTSATNALYGVWGSGPNDVWVVGTGNEMIHWDGTSWTPMHVGSSCNYYAVYGTSSSNIYAVGQSSSGPITVYYDGSSWHTSSNPGSGMARSLWVSPDNHIFVGESGWFLHNDGSGWKSVILGQVGMGFGMWGTDANNVYAIYEGGYLAHWDGSTVTTRQVAVDKLYGIWGTYGSDIWVCGKPYTIRHLEDPEWVTQTHLSSQLFMSKVDSTGNALWNEFGAQATFNMDDQTNISLAPDGAGGALLAWRDSRNGNWDIYARKVSISRGPIIATELRAFSAALVGGGVRVSWELSQFDEGAQFIISRATGLENPAWRIISPEIERSSLAFSFVDVDVKPGTSCRYRVEVLHHEEGSRVLFETESIAVPAPSLTLYQNVPNPFNPSTTIRYCLPEKCRVTLNVYDASGRRIVSLVDAEQPAGEYRTEWKGDDNLGRSVASGIYFCRLRAGRNELTRKMILLK